MDRIVSPHLLFVLAGHGRGDSALAELPDAVVGFLVLRLPILDGDLILRLEIGVGEEAVAGDDLVRDLQGAFVLHHAPEGGIVLDLLDGLIQLFRTDISF